MLGLGGYFYGGKQWENKEETLCLKMSDVDEVGATSAPLLSASYYIGDKCKPFNEDFYYVKNTMEVL